MILYSFLPVNWSLREPAKPPSSTNTTNCHDVNPWSSWDSAAFCYASASIVGLLSRLWVDQKSVNLVLSCRSGHEGWVRKVIASWWPCPCCHAVEHSIDRCPDFPMDKLLDNGREALGSYSRGEPDEAELLIDISQLEQCGICMQPDHRCGPCWRSSVHVVSWIKSFIKRHWLNAVKVLHWACWPLKVCSAPELQGILHNPQTIILWDESMHVYFYAPDVHRWCWIHEIEYILRRVLDIRGRLDMSTVQSLPMLLATASGNSIAWQSVGYSIASCPTLQAATSEHRQMMKEAWNNAEPLAILKVVNNLYCGYCDSYSHG
jgi:hypothetical protein